MYSQAKRFKNNTNNGDEKNKKYFFEKVITYKYMYTDLYWSSLKKGKCHLNNDCIV